jgi:hypothetical protein
LIEAIMRCPECHSHNEENAPACGTCGLLFVKKAEDTFTFSLRPKRRAEDLARTGRRASDRSAIPCKFCGGEIMSDAARCRHCSEIVNDDYYRERAQRLRARVNYASWVAYIFGLGALLVFRPVGLVSIAGGLLLSIIYYAIPVEPPRNARDKKKVKLSEFLKRQFKMERVQIPIPTMRQKKLVFVGTPLIAALVGYSANLFLLQEPMNDVLKQNSAFSGMQVSTHYEYWVVPGVVVYDLRSLTLRQAPIDVQTALLEFAKKVKTKRYSRVELSYRGVSKFSIDGASFQRLGEEYAKHNFDYVLYKFPRLFHSHDGTKVDTSERDALVAFHKRWYGEDTMTRSLQNGMLAAH